MGFSEQGDTSLKPKISGDLLLVIEVSQTFAKLTKARNMMQPKRMILLLESASLLLTGYYKKKSQGDIKKKIDDLHPLIDKLLSDFEQSGEKIGSKEVWKKLYEIEAELRQIWHDSGLQIGGNDGFSSDAEFA